ALRQAASGQPNASPWELWNTAASVAETAAEATAQLVPKVGRARPLAERSVGTPDPGAVSMALALRAVGRDRGRHNG
ncbi:MAG: DAK2 domain-containing protein, partial [Bifidobacteriaceae bacterium]|nr:DAK2 domain-containing protein [Bifidobacteriaceae bacterium]